MGGRLLWYVAAAAYIHGEQRRERLRDEAPKGFLRSRPICLRTHPFGKWNASHLEMLLSLVANGRSYHLSFANFLKNNYLLGWMSKSNIYFYGMS